jgi:hypothetical protein
MCANYQKDCKQIEAKTPQELEVEFSRRQSWGFFSPVKHN